MTTDTDPMQVLAPLQHLKDAVLHVHDAVIV